MQRGREREIPSPTSKRTQKRVVKSCSDKKKGNLKSSDIPNNPEKPREKKETESARKGVKGRRTAIRITKEVKEQRCQVPLPSDEGKRKKKKGMPRQIREGRNKKRKGKKSSRSQKRERTRTKNNLLYTFLKRRKRKKKTCYRRRKRKKKGKPGSGREKEKIRRQDLVYFLRTLQRKGKETGPMVDRKNTTYKVQWPRRKGSEEKDPC